MVGENIKKARRSLGLTQYQLGEAVGFSRQNIFLIEKGKQGISHYMIYEFCNALQCDPNFLFGCEPCKMPPPIKENEEKRKKIEEKLKSVKIKIKQLENELENIGIN